MRSLLVLLILLPCIDAVSISEVMYNPPGNDNNLEYVEVYSEDEVNLSEYSFEDSSSSDTLELLQLVDSTYSLIVEEGFNYSGIHASVYSAGASLGNNLNNQQDVVILRDKQGDIVDILSYTNDLGGNGNGMALCKNVTITECLPTPGAENEWTTTNDTDAGNDTVPSPEYGGLYINEFLPNPRGLDSDALPDGEWVELYNSGEGVDGGRLEICDRDWNCVKVTPATTGGSTFFPSGRYALVYMNGKSILNNAGDERVRLVFEGNILDEVPYEGSEEDMSWSLIDDRWVITQKTPGGKNKEESAAVSSLVNNSHIIIKTIDSGSDKKARFGDVVKVRVYAYKGGTRLQRISLSVENISAPVQWNVVENYRSYEVVLPIALAENCDGKFPDGAYKVVAEGLGMIAESFLQVNGSSRTCSSSTRFTALASSASDVERIINNTSQRHTIIPGSLAYLSPDERVKEYALYGFILALLLLLGYFLFHR